MKCNGVPSTQLTWICHSFLGTVIPLANCFRTWLAWLNEYLFGSKYVLCLPHSTHLQRLNGAGASRCQCLYYNRPLEPMVDGEINHVDPFCIEYTIHDNLHWSESQDLSRWQVLWQISCNGWFCSIALMTSSAVMVPSAFRALNGSLPVSRSIISCSASGK